MCGPCAGFGRPGTLPPRVIPFDADVEEVRSVTVDLLAAQEVADRVGTMWRNPAPEAV